MAARLHEFHIKRAENIQCESDLTFFCQGKGAPLHVLRNTG